MVPKTWEVGTRLDISHRGSVSIRQFSLIFGCRKYIAVTGIKIILVAGRDNVVYIIMLIEGILISRHSYCRVLLQFD